MVSCLSLLLQLGAATFSSFRPRWIQQRQLSLLQQPCAIRRGTDEDQIRRRLDWGSLLSSSVVMLSKDCCGDPRLVALIGDVFNEVVVFGCAELIAFHWINVVCVGQ